MPEASGLVSVVVPVYNGSNYVAEAVKSALDQTYSPIEVVVVDDGSRDGGSTEHVVKQFGPSVRYFRKENGGVSSALNFGIEASHGKYISWLSHDDRYEREKIAKQTAIYDSQPDSRFVVFSHEDFIDEHGDVIRRGTTHRYDERLLCFELIARRFIGGCTMLIPRMAFEEVGLFDETLYTVQDYDMWYRLLLAGYRFIYLPESLVQTRIHSQQTSNTLRGRHDFEKDALFSKYLAQFLDVHGMPSSAKLEYLLLRICARHAVSGSKNTASLAAAYVEAIAPRSPGGLLRRAIARIISARYELAPITR